MVELSSRSNRPPSIYPPEAFLGMATTADIRTGLREMIGFLLALDQWRLDDARRKR